MRKSFFFLIPHSLLLLSFVLLAACTGESGKPATSENPATDTPAVKTSSVNVPDVTLSGYLDTLLIDSLSIENLGKPPHRGNWTIFRFYIDSADYLTLAGWSANNSAGVFHGGGSNPPGMPDVILKESGKSTIKFGPGNYFGNLVLRPAQLLKIQLLLRSTHSKSVLFAPVAPATNFNQITYAIYVSDKTSANPFSTTLAATGELLNPSPPRNSN